jgi:hypothetical protein
MKRTDPPDIDPRDAAAVARQTAALAQRLSRWLPGDRPDAGMALIGAFATMAGQVITRLNQMPNRHFLAYLRMLGLQPCPPRAAEVPLTFTPSAGARGVRVPAGTQVRGQRADGARVTFYTRDALELLPAGRQALWRAITYQPPDAEGGLDRISINTAMATGNEDGHYRVFAGGEPVEHAVYLAADDVLAMADARVRLSITFADGGASIWRSLQASGIVAWEYFSDDGAWKPFAWPHDSARVDGCTYAFQLFDSRPPDMASCALPVAAEATRACWIRVRLTAWPPVAIPDWRGVMLNAMDPVDIEDFDPEQLLFNGVPIDTSKDYYPLGPQPAFNDCCTLVPGPLPDAPDAVLSVRVDISEQVQNETPDGCGNDSAVLAWEIGGGDTWRTIDPDSPDLVFDPANTDVSTLKASGEVRISLSAVPVGVDQPSLRIRLASGNYGTGITVSGDAVVDDGYRPPILHKITLGATCTPSATPVCVTDNGEGRRVENFAQPLTPFRLRADRKPAFYLAFGETLGQASVSLYMDVAPLSGATRQEVQAALQNGVDTAEVAWDYSVSGPSGNPHWKPLQVEDGTHGFTQSGFLRFIAPADLARSAQFGSAPLYWLRARLHAGVYAVPPQAGRVLPNSVAACNARTIRDEVLGSSRQTPGQTFELAHTPILADPELVVREPARPFDGPAARSRAGSGSSPAMPLAAHPGTSASAMPGDAGTGCVRWTQVGSFAASGPLDRHYTLDHQNGTVVFGDGRNGMVPPAGKNNIVMARYRPGGGAPGNRPAGAIDQLVTAVAHVAAVGNAVASSGGADGEANDAVMDWGPRVLRHRGRAVARQDYEDLVRQAFPQIAKVSALTPISDPSNPPGMATGAGQVLIIVVPDGTGDRPAPSAGLLRQVGDFLRTCMPPAVRLSLSGPDWLTVDVKVAVKTRRTDRTGALRDEVEGALRRFLNPLSGGFDGTGWALGQMVHDSDVMRCLLALPGVDSASGLEITRTSAAAGREGSTDMDENVADQKLTVILVCPGRHMVTVEPADLAGSA